MSKRKIATAIDCTNLAIFFAQRMEAHLQDIHAADTAHKISDEQRAALSATAQAAVNNLLRATFALSEIVVLPPTIQPYAGAKLCDCGTPALWTQQVHIGNGPRLDTLHLCTLHLIESR